MAGLLDLLNSDIGKTLVSGASQQLGQNKAQTTSALSAALPLILGAMKNNASPPQGAEGLLGALSGKHDGGILDNLSGLFGGGVDDSVLNDGAGILGHVLGGRQPQVENALSQKSGMDANAVANILKTAAPILMGVLGKQSREKNVNNSNDLGGLIGGLLGGSSADKEQSFLEQILDADGDGSVVDDVAGMILGGASKQKSGGMLGGLLGGLFGKK